MKIKKFEAFVAVFAITVVFAGLWQFWGDLNKGPKQEQFAAAEPRPTPEDIQSLRKARKRVAKEQQAPSTRAIKGPGMGQFIVSTASSGTWVVPGGVTSIDLLLIGGGGGGASAGDGGAGGGGGSISRTSYAVTPGVGITYAVGAGGAANSNGSNSTFDGLTAGGGQGCVSGQTGAAGGTGDYAGGDGGDGSAGIAGGGGGGSGGRSAAGNDGDDFGAGGAGGAAVTDGGAGGDGDDGSGNPQAGAAPGGGGGGSGSMVAGGAGAVGYLQIDWSSSPPADAFKAIIEARARQQRESMWTFRQSTAGQEVPLGKFVDEADGVTALTALTIANTDIKLQKTGGTTLVSKNSGGATHISGGRYYAVLDATDTDTIGPMKITVDVAGALPVEVWCEVLDEAVYDVKYGTTAPSTLGATPAVNVTQWSGSAVSTPDTAGVPEVNVIEWRGTTPSTMAAGAIRADLDSVKTQSVTCANPITILASVGTASTSEAQTGDGYAVVSSGTHGNAALKTLIDTVDNFIDTEITDIQSRLPAALVSGRMDSSVGAMAANTLTASALATDAVTEIQSGLATAADGTVVKCGAAFTSTAGTEVRISAWLERAGEVVVLPSGECTVTFREHGSGSDLFTVTDSAPNAQGVFELTQASPAFTSDRLYLASVEIEDDTAVVYTSKQAVPVR